MVNFSEAGSRVSQQLLDHTAVMAWGKLVSDRPTFRVRIQKRIKASAAAMPGAASCNNSTDDDTIPGEPCAIKEWSTKLSDPTLGVFESVPHLRLGTLSEGINFILTGSSDGDVRARGNTQPKCEGIFAHAAVYKCSWELP